MDLQDSIYKINKAKVFHLEAYQGDKLFIGSSIKANDLEEAKLIMKCCFIEKFEKDTEIYCVQEEWLN